MLRENARFCDGCGQKLPASAKLSQQPVSKNEAARMGAAGVENPDGTVSIDLCLACRVKRANRIQHGHS